MSELPMNPDDELVSVSPELASAINDIFAEASDTEESPEYRLLRQRDDGLAFVLPLHLEMLLRAVLTLTERVISSLDAPLLHLMAETNEDGDEVVSADAELFMARARLRITQGQISALGQLRKHLDTGESLDEPAALSVLQGLNVLHHLLMALSSPSSADPDAPEASAEVIGLSSALVALLSQELIDALS